MKKPMKPPFLIKVEDYHDFPYVERTLNVMNPKIKVAELMRSELEAKFGGQAADMLDNLEPYIGVVYVGNKPSTKQILQLLIEQEEIPEVG